VEAAHEDAVMGAAQELAHLAAPVRHLDRDEARRGIERDRSHSGGARPGRRVLAALESRQLQDRAGKVRGRLVEIGG